MYDKESYTVEDKSAFLIIPDEIKGSLSGIEEIEGEIEDVIR